MPSLSAEVASGTAIPTSKPCLQAREKLTSKQSHISTATLMDSLTLSKLFSPVQVGLLTLSQLHRDGTTDTDVTEKASVPLSPQLLP